MRNWVRHCIARLFPWLFKWKTKTIVKEHRADPNRFIPRVNALGELVLPNGLAAAAGAFGDAAIARSINDAPPIQHISSENAHSSSAGNDDSISSLVTLLMARSSTPPVTSARGGDGASAFAVSNHGATQPPVDANTFFTPFQDPFVGGPFDNGGNRRAGRLGAQPPGNASDGNGGGGGGGGGGAGGGSHGGDGSDAGAPGKNPTAEQAADLKSLFNMVNAMNASGQSPLSFTLTPQSGGSQSFILTPQSSTSNTPTPTPSSNSTTSATTTPPSTQKIGTTLTLTDTPVVNGQVTITGSIHAADGSTVSEGSVSFYDNGTFLGSANVTGGVATLTTGNLQDGANTFQGVYSGTASYGASISPVLDPENDPPPPTLLSVVNESYSPSIESVTGSLGTLPGSYHVLPTGQGPIAVQIGHLAGQDTNDVTSLNADGTLTVALNNDNGYWRTVTTYDTGLTQANGLVLGRFFNNPYDDIAIQGPNSIVILEGNGLGQFWVAQTLSAPAAGSFAPSEGDTVQPAVINLDNSGNQALVSVSPSTNQLLVYPNLGNGFGTPVAYNSGASEPVSVVVGDFIGDALPDIAVGHRDGSVTFFQGMAGGTFQPRPDLKVTGLGAIQSMATGNFAGTGNQIAVSSSTGVTVLSNSHNPADLANAIANGSFAGGLTGWTVTSGTVISSHGITQLQEATTALTSTLQTTFVVPDNPQSLSFDLAALGLEAPNGGVPDAFEVSLLDGQNNSLVQTISNEATSFINWQPDGTVSKGSGVTFDGRRVTLDVSQLTPGTTATLIFDLIGNPPGTASTASIANVQVTQQPLNETFSTTALTAASGLAGIAAGDVNGDGHADIVVANTPQDSLLVYTGDGAGSFTPSSVDLSSFGTGASAVAVAPLLPNSTADNLAVALTTSNLVVDPLIFDTVAPTAAVTSPANGQILNTSVSQIQVQFSKAVIDNGATGNHSVTNSAAYVVTDTDTNQVIGVRSVNYDAATFLATLSLASSFLDGHYRVNVNGSDATHAIEDLAGTHLNDGSDTTSTFAIDTVAPTVALVSPASGQPTTDPVSQIQVQFSEAMQDSGAAGLHSVTNPASYVLLDGNNQPVTISSVGYNPVTFAAILTIEHAPLAAFTYQLTVDAADAQHGLEDLAGNALNGGIDPSFSFEVLNAAPTITSISNLSGNEGQGLSFSATFTDSSALSHTATITWGDGTTSDGTVVESNGQGTITATHAYANDGSYTITLTVTSSTSQSATAQAAAAVANVAPTVLTASNLSGNEGQTLSFSGTFSDPGVADTHTALVAWGDGSTSVGVVSEANGQGVVSATHVYADNGDYTITLTVTDDAGASGSLDATATTANVAPTVLTASNLSGNEGQTLNFTGTFSDPGTVDTHSALVNWGDGSTSVGVVTESNGQGTVTAAHTYADDGVYTVTLTVTDNDGQSGSLTSTSTVANVAPSVLSASNLAGSEGQSLALTGTFSDVGTADSHTATIAWGDGTTSVGTVVESNGQGTVTATHAYATAGTFTITLTVTDDDGASSSLDAAASVTNSAPTIQTASNVNGTEGQLVTFSGTFFDPGTADSHSATIAWGDGSTSIGTVVESNGQGTVTGSHTYVDNGSYTIVLTVTDNLGASDSLAATATIVNAAPAVLTASSLSGNEGQSVNFTGTFSDPGTADTHTATIDWGDGTSTAGVVVEANGQGTVTASHVYADNGTYTITLTVTDNGGLSGSLGATATIANVAPTVLAASNLSGGEGQPLSFSGTFSDPGTADTHTAVIAWGDGTTSVGTISESQGSGTVTGSHVYATYGNYTITLTVADDDGASASLGATATIANAAPSVLTASNISGTEGQSLSFTGTFTDSGTADTHTALIAWGDGTTSTGIVMEANGSGTVTASHTYAKFGNYTITLSVTDNGGASGTRSASATVADAPLTSQGTTFTALEGAAFHDVTVAAFQDGNPFGVASDFTATIDWNDGTTPSTGTVVSDGHGGFLVRGSHRYAEEGNYTAHVTIADAGGSQAAPSSTVSVSDPSVVATGSLTIAAAQGLNFAPQSLATFTDPGGAEGLGSYAAQVAWGDGSTSIGTITFNSSTEVFSVSGSHGYAAKGTYTITVTIAHESSAPVSVTDTASVIVAAGILLLDPNESGALTISGNGRVVIGGSSSIIIDSSSSSGIVMSGNGTAQATEFDVSGVPGTSLSGNATLVGAVNRGVVPTLDPLSGLAIPSNSGPTFSAVNASGTTTLTLQPGTYVGGIHASGQATLILQPGIYYLQGGGFSISGQASVTGNGVMLYNAPGASGGSISLSGQGAVNLTAPTTGTYKGIVIFQDRTSTAPLSISGSGHTTIVGAVYAARARVTLSGNGGVNGQGVPVDTLGSEFIVDDMRISGNGTFQVAGNVLMGTVTTFYTVDRAACQMFHYDAAGNVLNATNLADANPVGVTADATGQTIWVSDANGSIYVYSSSGSLKGSWSAQQITNPQDLATNGADIWVLDATAKRVYRYSGAASRLNGTQAPTSSFALDAGDQDPTGLATDGTTIWVTDRASGKVFVYSASSGSKLGSWSLDPNNTDATGVTLNPNNVGDLWVVDRQKATVFHYRGATAWRSGSPAATDTFALVGADADAEGIADPNMPPTANEPMMIDPSGMEDVTALGKLDFTGTTFNRHTGILHAAVQLTNTSTIALGGSVTAAIGPITPPAVSVVIADDYLPDGRALLGFTDEIAGGNLLPGQTTSSVEIGFDESANERFAFNVTLLKPANQTVSFQSQPPTQIAVGSLYSYAPTVTGGDGSAFTYSLSIAPTGMTIDASTGAITWTPVGNQAGSNNVILHVSDGHGDAADQQFTVQVVSHAPVIFGAPTVTTVLAGQTFGYDVNATDPDGDTLSYTLAQAPAGMTINSSTGQLSWLTTNADVGAAPVTIAVSDGTFTVTQSFTVNVVSTAAQAISGRVYEDSTGHPPLAGWSVFLDQNGNAVLDPAETSTTTDAQGNYSFNNLASGTYSVVENPPAGWVGTTPIGGSGTVTLNGTQGAVPAGDSIPVPAGKVDWWTGDNTTNDLLGNANGVAEGSLQYGSGIVDQAFSLNGVDAYVDAGNNPVDQFGNTGSFTISAWVNFNTLSHPPGANGPGVPAGDMSIMDKMHGTGSTPNTDGWRLMKQDDNHIWFGVGEPNNGIQATAGSTVRSPDAVTTNTWYFVAATMSATTMNLYINGSLVASKARPTFTNTDTTNLLLGGNGPELSRLDGQIDEAEVFNRALTASEVASLYQAGSAGEDKGVPHPGEVVGYLDFGNQQTGTNHTPAFTSTPVTAATTGQLYQYHAVASDPDGDRLQYALVGRPAGMVIDPNSGQIAWVPTQDQVGPQTVTVRASDGRGGIVQQTFTVTVASTTTNPNAQPPLIQSTPLTSILQSQTYRYAVQAVDPGNFPLTYAVVSGPAGMTVDSNGVVTWDTTGVTPTGYAVTLAVTDSQGFAAQQSFTVNVLNVAAGTIEGTVFNDLNGDGVQDTALGQSQTFDPSQQFSTTDNPNGVWSYGWRQSLTDPTFHFYQFAGTSQGIDNWLDSGNLPGLFHNSTQTLVRIGTTFLAPGEIALHPGQNGENSVLQFTAPFAGTYQLSAFFAPRDTSPGGTDVHVRLNGASLFDGATGNGLTASYDGNLTLNAGDTIEFLVGRGADGSYNDDLTSLETQITGTPTTSEPSLAGRTVYLDQNGDGRYEAGDPTAVTDATGQYQFTNLAPDSYRVAEIIPSGWATTQPVGGAATVTVASGATTTQNFGDQTASTVNESPYFTSNAPRYAEVSENYQYQAVAVDPNGDPLQYSLVSAPSGMVIDAATGRIAWTPTATEVGSQVVSVQVSDGRGGTATQTFSLNVVSTQAPVITSTAPTSILFGQTYTYAVTVIDPLSTSLNYALVSGPDGMAIDANTGVLTWIPTSAQLANGVTLSVTDGLGRTATQSFSIDVLNGTGGNVQGTVFNDLNGNAVQDSAAIPDVFDPAAQFSATDNPNGVWSYGWRPTLTPGSTFTYDTPVTPPPSSGFEAWVGNLASDGNPSITYNPTDHYILDRGTAFANPGELIFHPGPNGEYSDVRFTAPYTGVFQVHSFWAARDLFAGGTDVEVAVNGAVIFNGSTGLNKTDAFTSSALNLNQGDTIELLVGYGANGTFFFDSTLLNVQIQGTRVITLADSVQDFSGTQGQNGWYYGYYATPPNTSSFQLMSQFTPNTTLSSVGNTWYEQNGTYWTELWANGGHPNAVFTSGGRQAVNQWTVRRWVSDVNGTVDVTGLLSKLPGQLGGDGTIGQIMLNGNPIFTQSIGANDQTGVNYHVTASVHVGDNLDFVIEPGPSDILDSTRFTATITMPAARQEPGLAGRTVYLDLNGNHQLDAADPTAVTDALGNYQFTNLAPGTYQVAEVVPANWFATAPTGAEATVTVADSTTSTLNFGNQNTSTVERSPVFTTTAPTSATVGQAFVYAALASDPDGDALQYSSVSAPEGMVIDPNTGLIVWVPTLNEQGTQTVTVQASDGRGGIARQTFQVQVGAATNNGITITSTPNLIATEGDVYSYDVTVHDEAGAPSFHLSDAPDGMTIDSATGHLTWTPTHDQVGPNLVTIVAADVFGTAYQTFVVNARIPSVAPSVSTNPPALTLTAGQTYHYLVTATDPTDAVRYSLISGPDGMTIDAVSGNLVWASTPTSAGTYPIDIRVTNDRGLTADQTFTLTVTPDTTPPNVVILPSVTSAVIGETVIVHVVAGDNVGVASKALTVNGQAVTLDANAVATYTATVAGVQELVATATDTSGNVGTATAALAVADPNDITPPTVDLTTADGSTISYLTPITGTVTDPNLVSYKVEYSLTGTDQWTTFATGTQAVVNGTLGTFDPTLLQNNQYTIRVTAVDASGNTSEQSIALNVIGNAKIGNFHLEYTDLQIPLAGIPITIKRVYDTLQANQLGDFGYGWQLSLLDPQIHVTLPVVPGQQGGGIFSAEPPYKAGTKIYLTDPDGNRVGFTFTPTEQDVIDTPDGPGLPPFGPIYHPVFTPDPGVYDKLVVQDIPLMKDAGGGFRFYGFGFAYNPDTFTLTTKDNVSYTYNMFTGLQSVSDLNGNTLTVTANGITSSGGASIQFVRDGNGLIKQIIDPAGHAINYTYDGSLNLTEVENQVGNESMYDYSTTLPHFMTSANDPSCGCTNMGSAQFMTFGPDGRLASVADGLGNASTSTYDLTHFTETVKDQLGNPTTLVYDAMGNVVSQTDPLGQTTSRVYDGNNNLISITDPRGLTTTATYDDRGNQLTVTQPGGNVWSATYNAFNKTTSVTDALGRTSNYVYDARANLIGILDAAGNLASYTYDGQGRLTSKTDNDGNKTTFVYGTASRPVKVINADQTFSTVEYNDLQLPTRFVDENGHETLFAYDDLGRLITDTDAQGHVVATTYNANNQIATRTDAMGRTTRYTYDAAGRVSTVIDALDGVTRYDYDAKGQLIQVTDPSGRVVGYTYTPNGQVASITKGDPSTWHYEYDGDGNLVKETDANGNARTYEYNSLNQMVKTTNALGGAQVFTYDALGNRLTGTDEKGNTYTEVYDALNNRVREIDPQDGVTAYTYDGNSSLTSITDANGHTTLYSSDSRNRLVSITDALGGVTSYGYDGVGNLTSETDALGRTTRHVFDSLNRETATIDPMGHQTSYAYDGVGNLVGITDALGRTTQFAFDALNRVTDVTDAAGGVSHNEYDAAGNLLSATDQLGQATSYQYDDQARLISETDPRGGVTRHAYDANGNRTSVTDPLGLTTTDTYNAMNWLVAETDPLGGVTQYARDQVGLLASVTDPTGNTTSYRYDTLDRLVQQTDAIGNSSSLVYDAVGNVVQTTDRDGRTVNYHYDALDQKTQESWASGVVFNYSYDAVGNVVSASDETNSHTNSSYTMAYNANDQVTAIDNFGTANVPHTILSYGYDAVGNTTSVGDNFGAEVNSTYNSRNLLETRTWQGAGISPVKVAFGYDAAGQQTQLNRYADLAGTQLVSSSTSVYDASGNLTDLSHKDGSGNTVAAYHYTFDLANELTSETNNGAASNYTYDLNGQLLTATHANQPNEGYTLDANGNRTSNGTVVGPNNEIVQDSQYVYRYDNEGNLIRKTEIATGNATVYTYDFRNRLTDVVEKDSAGNVLHSSHYVYDVFDRRISTTVDGTTTYTVYNGDQTWADFSATGTVTARYLMGDGPDDLLARFQPGNGVSWYLSDHLGSVRDIVNAAGTVIDHIDYNSFGLVVAETNPVTGDRFKFTGREYDASTGLYFYRARYYDPAQGRFISQDPISFEAGDTNLYRYVGNDAVNATDPSGMVEVIEAAKTGIIRGAIAGAIGGFVCSYAQAWAKGKTGSAALADAALGAVAGAAIGAAIGGVTPFVTSIAGPGLSAFFGIVSTAIGIIEAGGTIVELTAAAQNPDAGKDDLAKAICFVAQIVATRVAKKVGGKTQPTICPAGCSKSEALSTPIDPKTPGRPDPAKSIDSRAIVGGKDQTSTGYPRDSRKAWQIWAEQHPETLSENNKKLINGINPRTGKSQDPRAPRIDDTWLESFPEHGAYKNKDLRLHHAQWVNPETGQLENGPYLQPVPKPTHLGEESWWHGNLEQQ